MIVPCDIIALVQNLGQIENIRLSHAHPTSAQYSLNPKLSACQLQILQPAGRNAPTSTMQHQLTIGVLALQGAFIEHIKLLQQAASILQDAAEQEQKFQITCFEVRTPAQLSTCDALILPGGESTSISLIAERTGILEPLRDFVKLQRKPVWGTCAGLILLAESANKSKLSGQELIGGLDVRVQRNYFGRQVESFEAELDLPFLGKGEKPFHSVFIRAPVVEKVLPLSSRLVEAEGIVSAPSRRETSAEVEILGRLPGRAKAIRDKTTTAEELGEDGDIIAVRQGNVFGTAFHPELTGDPRIHAWWLLEVMRLKSEQK